MELNVLKRLMINKILISVVTLLLIVTVILTESTGNEQVTDTDTDPTPSIKLESTRYTVDNKINSDTDDSKAIDEQEHIHDELSEQIATGDFPPPTNPSVLSAIISNEKISIDSGAKSYSFYDLVDGQYSFTVDESEYSNIVFKWDFGDLFIWNDEKWEKIERDTEGIVSSSERISGILYDIGPEFTLLTTGVRTLHIDVLGYPVEQESPIKPVAIANSNSGAKYSSLGIISRDQWGASPISWDPNSNRDIDDPARFTWMPGYYRASRFVIHHTATPVNNSNPSKPVRDIYLYHAYSRGWGDIGYNYLIDQYGNIYEGKAGGDEVYGYHAYTEANTMSIGIALIGDYQYTEPPQPMKDALVRLLAERSVFYDIPMRTSNGSLTDWLDVNVNVFGHNESYFWCTSSHPLSYLCPSGSKWVVNSTACPGNGVKSILSAEIVPQATNYAKFNFTTLKDAVLRVDEQLETTPTELASFIIEYDLPPETSEATIRQKLPKFSGVESYSVNKNRVIVTVGDWNDGVLVPTVGWNGFYNNTFFPASEGKRDRIRSLMKIFLMDPEVSNVYIQNQYKLQPL